MGLTILECQGGEIVLPDPTLVLVGREDGGNLIVKPPRPVWERSELSPDELSRWSFLVAATGRAMLDALPQLDGGCINYWEAGNWALNIEAEPKGSKTAPEYRRVHAHLLGRSRTSSDPSLRWGEAPKFPDFADRFSWAAGHDRLKPGECRTVVEMVEQTLTSRYGFEPAQITRWRTCSGCRYPIPARNKAMESCNECQKE